MVFGLSQTSLAQEAAETQVLELYVGEIKTLLIEGIEQAVVADEDLLTLEYAPPNVLTLTALRGGNTQLLYWVRGQLHFMEISIVAPEPLKTFAVGPRFIPDLPYFTYTFQNTAGFSRRGFYTEPRFNHLLNSYWAVGNRRWTQRLSYSHEQKAFEGKFRGLTVTYADPFQEWILAEANGSLTHLSSAPLGGFSLFGAVGQFKDVLVQKMNRYEKIPWHDRVHVFGGVKVPPHLGFIRAEEPLFGMHYELSRDDLRYLYTEFRNVGFVSFQSATSRRRLIGAVIENTFNLAPGLTLRQGMYTSGNHFSVLLAPVVEHTLGSVQTLFRYVPQGFEGVRSLKSPFNAYVYQVSTVFWTDVYRHWVLEPHGQYELDNFSGSRAYQDRWIGLLRIRHIPSQRQQQNLSYSVLKSHTLGQNAVTHSGGLGFGYAVSPFDSLDHSLQYSRLMGADSLHRLSGATQYAHEFALFRLGATVRLDLEMAPRESKQGLSLVSQTVIPFSRHFLQTLVGYQKARFSDPNHTVFVSSQVQLRPTSLHLLSLQGTLSANVGKQVTWAGTVGILFQVILGPGVEGESLFGNLFGSGAQFGVKGRVYEDRNYNSFFETEVDKAISQASVSVNGDRKTSTAADGMYHFGGLSEGEHSLRLDQKSVPELASLTGPNPQTVEIRGADKLIKIRDFPMVVPKASVRVQVILDVNRNNEHDARDISFHLPKIYLKDTQGQVHIRSGMGGAIFRGIDKGKVEVYVDPTDLPDNADLAGESVQEVDLQTEQEYSVLFLVTPFRSLRGQIKWDDPNQPLPPGITVAFGERRSDLDASGFYWLRDLDPGFGEIRLEGLPPEACIKTPVSALQKSIPEYPYEEVVEITLQRCLPKFLEPGAFYSPMPPPPPAAGVNSQLVFSELASGLPPKTVTPTYRSTEDAPPSPPMAISPFVSESKSPTPPSFASVMPVMLLVPITVRVAASALSTRTADAAPAPSSEMETSTSVSSDKYDAFPAVKVVAATFV
jgi:hypothetical protein